ncbi:MAG: alpha-ketoacid dehydrogenase subunit alpha/beta [Anaerolineae bacterium]
MSRSRRAEPKIAPVILKAIYRNMVRIRLFEERAREMYQAGQLPRHGHLCTGQEAVAAAAVAAVKETDYIATTHRGHGHTIARAGDMKGCMAELFGKAAGLCRGRGGTMHTADYEKAMLGAFPVVGASIPIAVGGALAARALGEGRISLAFFGDGAANQGTFHEGINLAAIWDLPVVFVCENNQYAIFTRQSNAMRLDNIADRAQAYGIPGIVVDGNNALAVYVAVREAAERARNGKGPTLIEAKTYRWGGHHTGDPGTVYRSREEVAAWKEKDPIPRLRDHLLELGLAREDELQQLETAAKIELEEAVAYAQSAPEPEPTEALTDVFAPAYHCGDRAPSAGERDLTGIQALNEALQEEMERDPRLLILGEDIAVRGGPFGVTKGLVDRFGRQRVLDTPISESGFVGAAVGAAMAGVPTVVEVGFIDFCTTAMDPIVNAAAKAFYTSAGRQTVPMVIRTQEGGGVGGGPTHSQCLEAWFAHVPGLKVVLPSTPYDYKGLLKTAIRDPNPVVFIEHKLLYRTRGPVPSEEYCLPMGEAVIRRPGRDVTVVALAAMVSRALQAANTLAAEGIDIEVIDPRTLVPLDAETITRSVRRTGRLIVLQEAALCCSFGAEIARVVGQMAFDYLEAPIEVVGTTAPIPFAPALEKIAIPAERELVAAVRRSMGRSDL